MGNALRKSPTVNVDAGDWTSAYNLASKTVQRQRTQTLLLLGKSSTDEATEHASVQKEGSKVAAVNDYHVVKTLGKGAFGEVFLTQRGGEKFAMKVLKKSALKKMRIGRGGSAFDSIKTEIATMKKIGHPNCVQMFDVILDDEQDEVHLLPLSKLSPLPLTLTRARMLSYRAQVFLVLEFVDGGPSQVKGSDGKYVLLPERTVWSHLRHLVMGLECVCLPSRSRRHSHERTATHHRSKTAAATRRVNSEPPARFGRFVLGRAPQVSAHERHRPP